MEAMANQQMLEERILQMSQDIAMEALTNQQLLEERILQVSQDRAMNSGGQDDVLKVRMMFWRPRVLPGVKDEVLEVNIRFKYTIMFWLRLGPGGQYDVPEVSMRFQRSV